MDFTNYTDWSLQLAIDLVNTDHVARRRELMPDLATAREFLHDHGVTASLGDGDLPRLRSLRDDLRGVFEAGEAPRAVERVNAILARHRSSPRVTIDDGVPRLCADECADAVDYVGAAAGLALANVLCATGVERLGVCASDTCRDAFIDLSKNSCKRYCSDGCARLSSVRAYRKRARANAN